MRRHRRIGRLGLMLCLCIACAIVMTILVTGSRSRGTSGDKGEETIVGWMIDKIASGEVELSEEDSIRQAIAEGETELGISLTEENKDRIVTFMKTLDSIEVGAEDFMDQAKQMYHKYSAEFVEEANETINKAVEGAVKGAVENFFDSITRSIQDFFSSLGK